jgi:hypothetical protein
MTIIDIILIATFLICCYACYLSVTMFRKLKASQGIASPAALKDMDNRIKRELDMALALDMDIVQELIPQSL